MRGQSIYPEKLIIPHLVHTNFEFCVVLIQKWLWFPDLSSHGVIGIGIAVLDRYCFAPPHNGAVHSFSHTSRALLFASVRSLEAHREVQVLTIVSQKTSVALCFGQIEGLGETKRASLVVGTRASIYLDRTKGLPGSNFWTHSPPPHPPGGLFFR